MQTQRGKAPLSDCEAVAMAPRQQRARRVSMQTQREKAPCPIAKPWQ